MISTVHLTRISKIGVTPERRGLASISEIGSQRRFPQLPQSTFPERSSMFATPIPDHLLPPIPSP